MIKLPYEDNFFHCIIEDYAWEYREKGHRGNEGGTRPDQRLHPTYDRMSLAEIYACGPEILRVANPSCHRWTWVTEPFISDAIHMLTLQGFDIKRWFVWVKTTEGLNPKLGGCEQFTREELEIALRVMLAIGIPGKPYPRAGGRYWGKTCCEFLILSTNDRSFQIENRKKESQVFFGPSSRHSAKPDAAFETILRNSPGPRLSMFERSLRDGFYCWGREMETFA